MLEGNLDVAAVLSEHAGEMHECAGLRLNSKKYFQSELQQYQLRIQCHIREVKRYLAISEDIRILVRSLKYVIYLRMIQYSTANTICRFSK
jgi:hypothetical protein